MSYIVAFITGAVAALGLGGGFILVVYLTSIEKATQLKAQGVNLVFFIPVALCSLIFHCKNKLVDWAVAIPCAITGIAGAIVGFWLCGFCSDGLLRKIFGFFVIAVGISQLLMSRKKKSTE